MKKQPFRMHVGRLGSCLGLLRVPRGPRWGFKGAEIKHFENSGCHLEPPRTPQEPQRGAQEHQKGAQERPRTQKSSPRRGDIKVFEGGRVGEYVEIRVQMGFGGFVRPSASPSARLGSCFGLLKAPRGPRWGFRGAQIKRLKHSGCHRNAPRAPKGHPRGPQEHQRGAQESPNTF